MKIIFYLSILIIFTMFSCSEKCAVDCVHGAGFTAVGFSLNELDTVIVIVFSPNDSFNNVVDSETIIQSPPQTLFWVGNNDTLQNNSEQYCIYNYYDV